MHFKGFKLSHFQEVSQKTCMFVLLLAEAIDEYFDQILTLLEEVSQN